MRPVDDEYERIVAEADAGTYTPATFLREVNHCHGAGSGHPCEPGGKVANPPRVSIRASTYRDKPGFTIRSSGGDRPGARIFTSDRAKAERIKGLLRRGAAGEEIDKVLLGNSDDSVMAAPAAKHSLSAPDASKGATHAGDYRGMEIHTLPSYQTPYYYVNAPGFGSMQHSHILSRIKRQIDHFKDTGQTASGHAKAKASARYQKRKARYGA